MRTRHAFLLAAWLAVPAVAAVRPAAGPGDARIRHVRYDPDQVVEIAGTLGYQFPIEFGDGERIENVSIGDGLGWQVTPNHRADMLFLKPMLAHATTNMTVITSLRRYTFALRVVPHGTTAALFGLRFDYPVPAMATVQASAGPAAPLPPADVNHAFTYEGSTRNLPERVFDDGRFTYFAFRQAADFPAIFIAEGKKKESMAVTSMRDGLVVVDQLARRFVLRRGDDVTTIINDGYREPVPGPQAPQPAQKRKSR